MKKNSLIMSLYYFIFIISAMMITSLNATNKPILLSGLISFDQTIFCGSKDCREVFKSGVKIKSSSINLNGGIKDLLSYTLSLKMGDDTIVRINDSYITYTKFENNNLTFSIGQISSTYGLEATSSGTWNAFLHKSLVTNCFSAPQGLGISLNQWGEKYSFNASIKQPKQGTKSKSNYAESSGTAFNTSDKWNSSFRLTYLPVVQNDKMLQIGLSAYHEDDAGSFLRFKTTPEADARNTGVLLDTNSDNQRNRSIESRYHTIYSGDVALQSGPLKAEFEYQKMYIRDVDEFKNAKLYGYQFQTTYTLTGESRLFNKRNGTWKNMNIKSNVFEVGLRYSYLNLNGNDINGGIGCNTTLALNWYPNPNIKIGTNYVNSIQTLDDEKLKLDIFAIRLQLKY